MFSSLKAYVVQRDDIYYARTDKATGKRKMIPPDQYKALPADTRAALLKLKTVPRKDLEADASVKTAPTKKPDKSRKRMTQLLCWQLLLIRPLLPLVHFLSLVPPLVSLWSMILGKVLCRIMINDNTSWLLNMRKCPLRSLRRYISLACSLFLLHLKYLVRLRRF
jgi:hypothetical protein